MITYAGLGLIIVGWLVQLISKGKTLDKTFVLIYVLGVAFLTFDGLRGGITTMGTLNLVSGLVAAGVLLKGK